MSYLENGFFDLSPYIAISSEECPKLTCNWTQTMGPNSRRVVLLRNINGSYALVVRIPQRWSLPDLSRSLGSICFDGLNITRTT